MRPNMDPSLAIKKQHGLRSSTGTGHWFVRISPSSRTVENPSRSQMPPPSVLILFSHQIHVPPSLSTTSSTWLPFGTVFILWMRSAEVPSGERCGVGGSVC